MKSFENPVSAPHTTSSEAVHQPIPVTVAEAMYVQTRIQEQLYKLSQDDFDALIQSDFQKELHKNSPSEQPFNPAEELKQIRAADKSKKHELLDEFKVRLERHRISLAVCRKYIERAILHDNNVSKEYLEDIVDRFASAYGYTEETRTLISNIIEGFVVYRERAHNARKAYPNDRDLVKYLSNVELPEQAEIGILIGPMSLDIFADDEEAIRIFNRANEPMVTDMIRGFASYSSGSEPVLYTVVNVGTRVRRGTSDVFGKKTLLHEREHQKNKLLVETFGLKTYSNNTFSKYMNEKNQERKIEILVAFMKQVQSEALEFARDEFIAQLKSKTPVQLFKEFDSLFFDPNSPYDYLKDIKGHMMLSNDLVLQDMSNRYLVEEYEHILCEATSDAFRLIFEFDYAPQDLVALLTDKKIQDWSKTINRIIDQKEKGNLNL